MNTKSSLVELLSGTPVMPIVTLTQAEHSVALARALCLGGVGVIEITLRSDAALEAVRRIVDAVPEMIVGVGTVLRPEQLEQAERAGARFAVSPGMTSALWQAIDDVSIPLLPGVATPSDVMQALDHGFEILKFFPAENLGGCATLRAWSGPFAHAKFCPTGGIDSNLASHYLALPNVVCVGGSWLTPRASIDVGDWSAITALARRASGMRAGRVADESPT